MFLKRKWININYLKATKMKTIFIGITAKLLFFCTLIFLIGCDNSSALNILKKKTTARDSVLKTTVWVIDKVFVPEGNYQSAPIYVKTKNISIPIESGGSSSEKHLLFIKDALSKIYEIDNLQLWGQVNKGDTAILYYNNNTDIFSSSDVNFLDIQPIHK